MTCAEGDWHALAAQMFAASLRSYGLGVNVLGSSTPADVVAEFLGRSGGDALAISCSMPMSFPGAVRQADAAHQLGIPVLMGGRAFGSDARLATALGADAWARSGRDAALFITDWLDHPPAVSSTPTPVDPTGARLVQDGPELGAAALVAMAEHYPPLDDFSSARLANTREDLILLVQALGAALMVGEGSIFTDFLVWLRDVLAHRDVPAATLVAGLDAVRPLVEGEGPGAVRMLDDGRRLLLTGDGQRSLR